MSYNGAIGIGAGFYSNTSKPIIDAKDIYVDDNNRLSDVLEEGLTGGVDKKFGVDGSSLVGKELFHLDFDDNFNADKSLKDPEAYIVKGDARSIYIDHQGYVIPWVFSPISKEVATFIDDGATAVFSCSPVAGIDSGEIEVYYNRRFENGNWVNDVAKIPYDTDANALQLKVPAELLDKWLYTDTTLYETLSELGCVVYRASIYSMKRTGNFDCQGQVSTVEYYEASRKSRLIVSNAQPITTVAYEGIDLWLPYQPLAGDFSESYGAYAVGSNNIVSGFNGFAAGFNNIVLSDYGTTTGRENVVTYGAQAHGRANIVEGQWGVALGQGNTLSSNATYAFAAGRENKLDHSRAMALGFNLKSGTEYQTLLGRFNEVDNSALLVIGNGGKETSRNTIFTVSPTLVKATGSIETTRSITAVGNINTQSSITASGELYSKSKIRTDGGITTGASSTFGGSINMTKGSISGPNEVSTTASGKIFAGSNGISTTGKIETTQNLSVGGNISVIGSLDEGKGVITATKLVSNGDIVSSNGSISAKTVTGTKVEATSEVKTAFILADNITVTDGMKLNAEAIVLTENTANSGDAYKEYSVGGFTKGIYTVNIKSTTGDTATTTLVYEGGSYYSSTLSFITGSVDKTSFTTATYGVRLGNGLLKIYGPASKIAYVRLLKIAFLY